MSISGLDIVVLAAYFIIVLLAGVYFSRKNTSTEEYFVGGRSFGGLVIGLSLVGTSISSITFIAFPADAFKTTWIRYITAFMMPLAVWIASRYFLPFFRKEKITSAYEFLEGRFGPSIRLYTALVFLIAQLVRIAIILFLLSLIVQEITGLHPIWCVLIGGVFVSIYTIIGGIDAVVWTDVMQTAILVFGGIICLAVIVDKIPGGLSEIIDKAIEFKKLSFHELRDGELVPLALGVSLKEKAISMMLILGLTAWMTNYCNDQNIVQRYCAARSMKEARKAMWISVACSLPIWAFYMFLGTALFVFYQYYPADAATEILEGTRKAEQILPYFIIHNLPPGILGLVLSAALAAAMSSLDSNINSISTVFVVDIYRRHLRKGLEDRHYLRVAWAAATVASVFMIGGAIVLLYAETKTLQDTANILVSILGGGMLGIYMMGFFTKIGDARAVWVGIVITIIFTVWTVLCSKNLLPEEIHAPFELYYTGLVGNVLLFVVTFCVASFWAKGKQKLNSGV